MHKINTRRTNTTYCVCVCVCVCVCACVEGVCVCVCVCVCMGGCPLFLNSYYIRSCLVRMWVSTCIFWILVSTPHAACPSYIQYIQPS